MRKLFTTAVVVVSTLALCGAVIFILKDNSTLVPPPEVVSESFFKQLQMKRYSRAIPLLEKSLHSEVTPYVLSELAQEIEAGTGEIQRVTGKKGLIDGDSAEASVEIKGKLGSSNLPVQLVRQQGVWKLKTVMLNVHR